MKKMKAAVKGKVALGIAAIGLVLIFAAPMCNAASRGDNFNHLVVQTGLQKVLIGQNLQFEGFSVPPVVYRLVGGDIVNTYPADSNNRIYNVNWPTSGAYYVNYNSTTKEADAQLSVEDVYMPLELKVGTTTVSFIAVGTQLRVDTAGINLFDEDIVDLVISGPDGQIKYDMKNDQPFTGITVSKLKEYGDGLETTGWDIGDYTFQIRTESAQACGLDTVSDVKGVGRGVSYPEPTTVTSPKKEKEVEAPHLTPTATLTPIATPRVTATPSHTPILTPSPMPSPTVTPTALIPGFEFLFALIGVLAAVYLIWRRDIEGD
jgi:PGF-CTERM protein